MKQTFQSLMNYLTSGGHLNKEQALALANLDLTELCQLADQVRQQFCDSAFRLCTIINGKSGRCPEDCKYCAQSSHYPTAIEVYDLLPTAVITQSAQSNYSQGVHRFSIVTSGKRLTNQEVAELCKTYQSIAASCPIGLCASHGLLEKEQFQQLKAAGVSRYHCNLETSARFFPQICTTHSYQAKIKTLQAAKAAGLQLCSGGILGLGEGLEDRIDLAITLQQLGVTSIPLNLLNPIPGTPLAQQPPLKPEEVAQAVALFRILNPRAELRLAGGRTLLADHGASLFRCGVNAVISGDLLTTAGISPPTDRQLATQAGYTLTKEVN